MADVFVDHTKRDESVAHRLAEGLRGPGIEGGLSERFAGAPMDIDAVGDASVVVAVISPTERVYAGWADTLAAWHSRERIVVPALTARATRKDIPTPLVQRQYVELRDLEGALATIAGLVVERTQQPAPEQPPAPEYSRTAAAALTYAAAMLGPDPTPAQVTTAALL